MKNQELWKNQSKEIFTWKIINPPKGKPFCKTYEKQNGERYHTLVEIDFYGNTRIVWGGAYNPNLSFQDLTYDNYIEGKEYKSGMIVNVSVHYNHTTNNIISWVVINNL